MLAWVVFALVVSGLVAVGARALEEGLRAAGRPLRHLWLAALVGAVALVALGPVRAAPAGGADGLVVDAAMAASDGAASAHRLSGGPDPSAALGEVRAALVWPVRVAAELSSPGLERGLAAGWLVGTLLLLAGGLATLRRYRSARQRWPAREIAGTPVRVAPSSGPAVLGVLRPEIVVPAWLLERSAAEQRLAVAHEREHVRVGDTRMLTAGWLVAALLPWNPAIWWMLRRLRLAVELDCDARVLRQGVAPAEYGSMLIEVAGHAPGLSLGVPALTGSRTTLERRLVAMTTPLSRIASMRTLAVAVLGAVALTAACETRMPTSAEIEEMDAGEARAQAERLSLLAPDAEDVVYYLDGERVTAEEAHALAGDRLAHIEVVRGPDGEPPMIRIWSNERERSLHANELTIRGAAVRGSGDEARLRLRSEEGSGLAVHGSDMFEGLLFIDGEEASRADLRDLDPDGIERVEVVKGEAAMRLYDDPRAEHGVIRVFTRART